MTTKKCKNENRYAIAGNDVLRLMEDSLFHRLARKCCRIVASLIVSGHYINFLLGCFTEPPAAYPLETLF